MLVLLLSATAAVCLVVAVSLSLDAPLFQPLPISNLSAFHPSVVTKFGQNVWPDLPFNSTVNWDLTLSIQYYGRPMDPRHTNMVLGGISRMERSFASAGGPGDNVCPYIGGHDGPVAVHLVCTLGSPDMLSREQACRTLGKIWELMSMYAPPTEIKYALVERESKQIAYLLLKWEHQEES